MPAFLTPSTFQLFWFWRQLQENNLFYVNYLGLEFQLHFTHCHFHSSQLQSGKKRKMQSDDAMPSNQLTLCNVARSA